jgi:drug/metabolite transporter (DMT)-like permease
MTWFFIALGAPFLWALVNISDQYLVKKYSVGHRGSGGLVLYSSLVGVIIAILIGIFTPGIFEIPTVDKLILFLSGGLTILWIIIYLYTIEIEDISSIIPWFLTIPIFGYILGYLFLGETLTMMQLVGSAVVLFGVLLISIDFSLEERSKFKWKPALYMILCCLIIAVIGVIFKYVTIVERFWVSSFWEYFGLGMFGIFIYLYVPKYRREFNYMNKQGGKKIFTLNIAREVFTILGNFLTNYAILLAPITMVYLVGTFQPAIVLVLVIICTKFFPKIITEKIHRQILIPKIIAIAIMIVGSILTL